MASAETDLPLHPKESTPINHRPHETETDCQDLLAPPGWLKKIASRKGSSTPSLRDVYFITPDGEEIKSRKALDKYLKSHPGGLTASDFDWSTGNTPTRRSSRLSLKERPSPESSGSTGKRSKQKVVKDEAAKEVQGGDPEAMELDASTTAGKDTKENVVVLEEPWTKEKEEEKIEQKEQKEDIEEMDGSHTVENVSELAATEVSQMDVEEKQGTQASTIPDEKLEEEASYENRKEGTVSKNIKDDVNNQEDDKADPQECKIVEVKESFKTEDVEESVVSEAEAVEESLVSKTEGVEESLVSRLEGVQECLESKKEEVNESLEKKVEEIKEHNIQDEGKKGKTMERSDSVFQHCPEAPDAPRQVDANT